MKAAVTLRVRYYETDMMEVVHHTNHLRWFEMARVEFFRMANIDLLALRDEGIVYPVTSISCQYKTPARFDDILRVEAEPKHVTQAQCTLTYKIYREADEALICTGETQNVFTSVDTGKLVRLPKPYYERLQALLKE